MYDGGAMPDVYQVLRWAASYPAGSPLYTNGEQVRNLLSQDQKPIGVAIHAKFGRGVVNVWLTTGRVHIAGPATARLRLLHAILDWTRPIDAGMSRGRKRGRGPALPSPQELMNNA